MASPTKKVGIELIIIKCQSGVAKHVEVVSTTCYRGGQRQDPPQSVRPAVWPPHQEGRYPLSGQVPSLPLPYPSPTPRWPVWGQACYHQATVCLKTKLGQVSGRQPRCFLLIQLFIHELYNPTASILGKFCADYLETTWMLQFKWNSKK